MLIDSTTMSPEAPDGTCSSGAFLNPRAAFRKDGLPPGSLTVYLPRGWMVRALVDEGGTMSDPVGIAGDRNRSFVARIEQLDTELQELNEQKKEVFAEAKGEGFDVKGPCCTDQRADTVVLPSPGFRRCAQTSGVPAPACGSGP